MPLNFMGGGGGFHSINTVTSNVPHVLFCYTKYWKEYHVKKKMCIERKKEGKEMLEGKRMKVKRIEEENMK